MAGRRDRMRNVRGRACEACPLAPVRSPGLCLAHRRLLSHRIMETALHSGLTLCGVCKQLAPMPCQHHRISPAPFPRWW